MTHKNCKEALRRILVEGVRSDNELRSVSSIDDILRRVNFVMVPMIVHPIPILAICSQRERASALQVLNEIADDWKPGPSVRPPYRLHLPFGG